MFWFIPNATFKPIQCSSTFCFDVSDVIVEGEFYCLTHGTNALVTGKHPVRC